MNLNLDIWILFDIASSNQKFVYRRVMQRNNNCSLYLQRLKFHLGMSQAKCSKPLCDGHKSQNIQRNIDLFVMQTLTVGVEKKSENNFKTVFLNLDQMVSIRKTKT